MLERGRQRQIRNFVKAVMGSPILWFLPMSILFVIAIICLASLAVAARFFQILRNILRLLFPDKVTPKLDKSSELHGKTFVRLTHGMCHYRLDGETVNPKHVVLLLHGVSVTSSIWRDHIPILTRRGDTLVVSFDMYGHGFSDCPQGPPFVYTHAALADQAIDLLDHLGLGDRVFSVVGYSFGGLVAADLLARHAHRIRSVALVDPVGFHATPTAKDWLRLNWTFAPQAAVRGMYRALRFMALAEWAGTAGDALLRQISLGMEWTEADVQQVIRWQNIEIPDNNNNNNTNSGSNSNAVAGDNNEVDNGNTSSPDDNKSQTPYDNNNNNKDVASPAISIQEKGRSHYARRPGLQRQSFVRRILSMGREVVLLLVLWSWQTSLSPRGHVFAGIIRDLDMLDDYEDIITAAGKQDRPVLLLWGEEDWLVPVGVSRRFLSRMQNAWAIVLPGCGHNAPMQRPIAVAEEIATFLSQ